MDACTIDACDPATGTCRHDPRVCADDGDPCTTETCIPGLPQPDGCVHQPTPDGVACDDGLSCTGDDSCQAGACVPGYLIQPGEACDDGNTCTYGDACDDSARCVGTPLRPGDACSDLTACTQGDHCAATPDGGVTCVAGPGVDCSDGVPCTQDLCDPATGQCSHPPVDCDDGNACTADSCEPVTGQCRRSNVSGACDDGNYCTIGDACVDGNCVPAAPRDCSDGISCTVDHCEDKYCIHVPDSSLCGGTQCEPGICTATGCTYSQEVGTRCSIPESCLIGFCTHGGCRPNAQIPCNDGNPCTRDVCPGDRCTPQPEPDGTSCSTGNACAPSGVCGTGQCLPPTGPLCDDSDACTTDACQGASIGCSHTAISCDDGLDCTTDICSVSSGCAHQPHPAPEAEGVDFVDDQTMQWWPNDAAVSFNVYRGTIPAAMMGSRPSGSSYDHACFESSDAFGDGPLQTADASIPAHGTAFYYLVSGENACGESGLGHNHPGGGMIPAPRPNPSPCP